jgi:hypothetical protein
MKYYPVTRSKRMRGGSQYINTREINVYRYCDGDLAIRDSFCRIPNSIQIVMMSDDNVQTEVLRAGVFACQGKLVCTRLGKWLSEAWDDTS